MHQKVDEAKSLKDVVAMAKQATVLYGKGELEEAKKLFQDAIRYVDGVKELKNAPCAALHNNLGIIYNKQGDKERAIECYSRAIEICRRTQGERCKELVGFISNLGLLYREKGWLREAHNLFISAKRIATENNVVDQIVNRYLQKIETKLSAKKKNIEFSNN